jgi:hypothetical protein
MVKKMKQKFEVTTNNADVYVGLDIFKDKTKLNLWIRQALYVNKIVKRFGFENARPVGTPTNPNIHLELYLIIEMEKKKFFYPEIVGYLMFA